MEKGDRQNAGSEQVAGNREPQRATRPAPGKVTRTSRLSPGPEAAVQRKAAVPAAGAAASQPTRDFTSDMWMDAAHRGTTALAERGHAAVQALGGMDAADPASVQQAAAAGVRGSGGALPHLDRIQASFGEAHDLGQVRAHVGGGAAEASDRIGAQAYATGENIAFRSQPDLHTAAHEAAHVVQQRAGVQLQGGVGQAGDSYERQADAVADAVVQGKSASELLGGAGGSSGSQTVQRLATGAGAEGAASPAAASAPASPGLTAGRPASIQAAINEALAAGVPEGEVASFLTELGPFAGGAGQPDAAPAASGEPAVQARLAPGVAALGEATGAGPGASVQRSTAPGSAPVQRYADQDRQGGVSITLPGVTTVSGWQARFILTAAAATPGPIGPLFAAAVTAANAMNCTVGIGPAVAAGLGVGIGGGAGIVVAPGGVLGIYGSLAGACGAVFSASITLAVTVVGGGIDRFGGGCIAWTVAGGEVVVGGLSILSTLDAEFLGVCVQIGAGVGSPFEVYVQYQHTWTAGGE